MPRRGGATLLGLGATLLLGLAALPRLARGLGMQLELERAQLLGRDAAGRSRPESPGGTYGSWADAWAHGLPTAPADVPSSGSAKREIATQMGEIRSCFDKDCAPWLDDKGMRIEAHGAGLLKSPQDGRWYWYGESQKAEDLKTHGVNCYSADHLGGPWRREGTVELEMAGPGIPEHVLYSRRRRSEGPQVMRQNGISIPGIPGPYVIERPKVIYNKMTHKFVMWFHLDSANYQYRHVGVATSDRPAGPFTFVHAIQPDGIPSLDMSLWVDVDEKAYFVRSCNNNYTGISGLTDDYLNTTGLISTGPRLEGMALFRIPNGTLYMMTSHLTGWDPNPLMLFRANGPDLSDPQWEDLGNPTRDKRSFNTQPTYVVPYTTKDDETYFIYMADNWVHGGRNGLIDASYVWLPIRFESDGVFLDKQEVWNLEKPWARVRRSVSG